MWKFIKQLGGPQRFYQFSGQLLPWLMVLAITLFAYGLFGGLYLAPADYQQGDAFRIIYIHVPAAFLSMFVYVFMASNALIFLVWRIKLNDMIASSSAVIGAWFTFLALVTGSIWGKPMWGTWWIWDARLTSELILLFLYMGYIALRQAIPERDQAAKLSSVILLVGIINIPIIHYSVYWWHTLHQGATLSKFAKPSIDNSMLYPLLAMIVAFFVYFFMIMLIKVRTELLIREKGKQWTYEVLR